MIDLDIFGRGRIRELEYEKRELLRKIVAWLRSFCKGDLFDMNFRRRIIDVLVNSVFVFDDKIIIYYNVRGGKQVSYVEMLESYGEEGCPGPDDDLPEGSTSAAFGPPSETIVEPAIIFAGGLIGLVLPRPVDS